ncbi:hypothetical protein LENED_005866 [Lentinula edodes]|uniref:Protein kinase domain-containing protein n=1 Tax=Lentinula edodes TaxID=5353 RepID=A0A1Q3EA54_LENED|nr:hypothetical protein LENED_005866 [Lentinula edodes]
MFYVAILEARPSGRLQYANRFPLVETCKPEKTLQWLSDNLKTTLALSGHLIFYKLKQFIAITVGGQDAKLKCEPFINEDTLYIFGTPAFLKSTFQDLHLDHLGDTEQECICLVAIWTPSSDEYNSRATASLLPISEGNFDREAIIRAAQSRPPPSTGAKSTEFISTQTEQRPDAAYNYRPPELAPPPLAIYHPVFAQFRHSMAAPTETLEFTSQELDQASTFIDVSLRHYPDKTSRLNALQAVITCSGQKFWGERIILVDNGKKTQPDGGLAISIRDLPVLYSTLGELKNGGGDGGCDPSDQAQFVKFACRYGETGHRLLAEAGLAPRIYYCAFDETIGLWVIVMDYVEGVLCNGKLVGGEAKSLTRAIKLLHDNDLVFGDLREPNIIISKPRESVCVVDFEWCGPCKDIKEGGNVVQRRARYPTNIALSAEYNWAPGVEADGVIAKEHDNHRLQMMV